MYLKDFHETEAPVQPKTKAQRLADSLRRGMREVEEAHNNYGTYYGGWRGCALCAIALGENLEPGAPALCSGGPSKIALHLRYGKDLIQRTEAYFEGWIDRDEYGDYHETNTAQRHTFEETVAWLENGAHDDSN